MRLTGALIFAGAIASFSSILNYSCVDAQTNSTAAGGPDASSKAAVAGTADTKDKNFGLNAVSKAIVHEASRLESDAAGWDQKMQEIELDLNRSQQDDEATAKDVDESLSMCWIALSLMRLSKGTLLFAQCKLDGPSAMRPPMRNAPKTSK
jgi:hypothetical protein